jgi:uncharacterized membrane protein (UPF0127 family)
MNRALALLALFIVALSPACAQSPPASAFQPGQLRGFARDTLVIQRSAGRDQFTIWLAETPDQHQQGLMWVRQLPADHGMLFLLPQTRPMSMWMKNTFIPLDMIFIRSDGRILRIAENTEPHSEKIISSGGLAKGVLEVIGGTARKYGIQPGDRVAHPLFGTR